MSHNIPCSPQGGKLSQLIKPHLLYRDNLYYHQISTIEKTTGSWLERQYKHSWLQLDGLYISLDLTNSCYL